MIDLQKRIETTITTHRVPFPVPEYPRMSPQEMFNVVALHLLTQGKKALSIPNKNGSKHCVYRSPDQLKCAIGILIPDEVYTPDMEGYTLVKLLLKFPKLVTYIPHFALAHDLQWVHDGCGVSDWQHYLVAVGTSYNLDTSCIIGESK